MQNGLLLKISADLTIVKKLLRTNFDSVSHMVNFDGSISYYGFNYPTFHLSDQYDAKGGTGTCTLIVQFETCSDSCLCKRNMLIYRFQHGCLITAVSQVS